MDAQAPALGASVAVFRGVEAGPRVCLVLRANEPYARHWSLPGGRVRAGETPGRAASRELHEETGLSATVPIPVRRLRLDGAPAIVLHVHAARWTAGVPVPADDAIKAAFFALDDLPAPTTPHLAEILDEALARIAKG